MSTMIENRWDPRLQNQQGPITSGYVSNSDIRQRERQDQIKWERQREYDDIQTKPGEPDSGRPEQPQGPVYYKTGTTGMSLPIGGYEDSRKVYDDQRQKECIEFMAQKKDAEDKRREDLYMNSRYNYHPPPEPEMYDHNQISKDLREERQKEYNDYLKRKQAEETGRISHRHRYTPTGGLPIGQYEMQRKKLQDELRRDYKDSLLKREQDYQTTSRRRAPPTPPGGLNIATEQERKRVEDLKKSMYRDELLKQQKEQLFTRAQQQGEVPVLNRGSPTQAAPNRLSPRSPPRGRPPPYPDSDRRGQSMEDRMGPMSQDKQRPIGEVRTGFFDDRRQSPMNRDERQNEYQDFLAKKQQEEETRRQRLNEQRHAPRPEISKGDYYDANSYEQKRQNLNSQRKEEYQSFLAKTSRPSHRMYTPESLQGLPLGQQKYDQQKQTQEHQRNREYNEHLAKKTPDQNRREWRDTSGPKGIIAGEDSYNYDKRKTFAEERRQEYKDIMDKKYGTQPATKRYPDQGNTNSIGFVANMGYHDQERDRLNKERQGDYRKFLDERAYGKEGPPKGRPNWVDGKDSWYAQEPPPFNKSPAPVREQDPRPGSYGRRQQTPTYQEILESKRREEASYRRFDDPEYSRSGGPGGQYDRSDRYD